MNTHKSIFHLNKYQYTCNNNKNKNIKNANTQTRERMCSRQLINCINNNKYNKNGNMMKDLVWFGG